MIKTIYFDMDGTIVDLYGCNNWLEDLDAYNPRPYIQARPLCDMNKLEKLLNELQNRGISIGIVSWCSKNSTKEYDKLVRRAKKQWLAKNLSIHFDEIHIVKYGTPKYKIVKDRDGVLFDDEIQNLNQWRGIGIEPTDLIAKIEKIQLTL